MSWSEVQLGDGIQVKHGFAFKGEHFASSGEYLVLTPGNFLEKGGFRVRYGKERFYHADFPEEYLLTEGDLIVAMTEQGEGLLGSAARIPADGKYLHNQRLGLVQITNPDLFDKRFLYWVFNSANVRAQICATATGVKVRHTAPERIKKVRLKIPRLHEQQVIAWALDSYDELIATNLRRITLLEDAACGLYREWFIHLRFPGHELFPLENGVPSGWEKKNLFDVADVSYGYPFKSDQFNSDGVGFPAVRIRDIPPVSTSTYTTEEVDASYIIQRGDFLIGMDGIFHMNHWVGSNAYMVQRVCRVRSKREKLRAFLGLALFGPVKNLEASIQGATVAHLGAKHLKQIELLIPDGMDAELEALNTMLWEVITLREQNAKLAKARDLLLPKLMTGQLDVSNIRLPEDVVA